MVTAFPTVAMGLVVVSVTVKVWSPFLALLVMMVTSIHCIALLVEPVVKTKSIVIAT